jgi:hypothetical protein
MKAAGGQRDEQRRGKAIVYDAFSQYLDRIPEEDANNIITSRNAEEVHEFLRFSLENWSNEHPACTERTTKISDAEFDELLRVV